MRSSTTSWAWPRWRAAIRRPPHLHLNVRSRSTPTSSPHALRWPGRSTHRALTISQKQNSKRSKKRTRRQSARSAIDEYLEAIEERTASTRISYYLEGGVGYDSNTNGGTDSTNVFLPSINGTITLTDGTSRARLLCDGPPGRGPAP